jgi:hypothetical protein
VMKFIIAGILFLTSCNSAAAQSETHKSPFVLLPPIEWANDDASSSKEKAYFNGVLETYGFTLYALWPRNAKYEQQFSDFRQCVEQNADRNWPLLDWIFGKNLNASVASTMIRKNIPIACKDFVGKGDGGWSPPRIVSKSDWQAYGKEERKFYVAAFIEAATEFAVLQEQQDNISLLTECMKDGGLDKVLNNLKAVEMEWKHPMPWTLSKALGKTCKPS